MDLALKLLKAGHVVGHLEVAVHLLILLDVRFSTRALCGWVSSADGRRE